MQKKKHCNIEFTFVLHYEIEFVYISECWVVASLFVVAVVVFINMHFDILSYIHIACFLVFSLNLFCVFLHCLFNVCCM